jgi:hypothetical protein
MPNINVVNIHIYICLYMLVKMTLFKWFAQPSGACRQTLVGLMAFFFAYKTKCMQHIIRI